MIFNIKSDGYRGERHVNAADIIREEMCVLSPIMVNTIGMAVP